MSASILSSEKLRWNACKCNTFEIWAYIFTESKSCGFWIKKQRTMSWDQTDFSLIKEIHLRLEVTEETHWFRSLLKQIVSWWILKRILNVESCDFIVTPAFSTVPSDIRYFEILSTYFHNFSTPPSCIFFFGLPVMSCLRRCFLKCGYAAGTELLLQEWTSRFRVGTRRWGQDMALFPMCIHLL